MITVWFGLPPEKDSVIYFVSAASAKVAWKEGRTDVVCPLKAHRGLIAGPMVQSDFQRTQVSITFGAKSLSKES